MNNNFFTAKKTEEMFKLERELDFLISCDMDTDSKIKVLEDSFWRSHHAGYCDYMAGQRMAGVDDGQVEQHDLDCKYKAEVNRLLELLHDYKSDVFAEDWQKASNLFDTDHEAGFRAWLELCERGYARAAHSVAWCYRYGNGVDEDHEMAIKYYTLAIEGGYNSYNSLYWVYKNNQRQEDAIKILLEGVRRDDAACYEALASECGDGNIFGGNTRVAAYFATRAYELDRECSSMLFYYYLTGCFFPVVYPYAKYCFEHSGVTKEAFEECGIEFPEFWDLVDPIEPQYPDFGLTLDTCEDAVDPERLLEKAKNLLYADTPDLEGAKAYVKEAVSVGHSQSMYYAYDLNLDGCEDLLIRGANEYGDLDCIDLLAASFSDYATYKVGNIYLTNAIRYWNMRKKLHENVPMRKFVSEAYDKYSKNLDIMLGRKEREIAPDANAVKLTVDGSYERIKVDFDSLEGIYSPLGCDRINIISTQALRELSDTVGFTVVMYCDERGMLKHLDENCMAADISGCDVIWGDVVICGFEKDIIPFDKNEIDKICRLIDGKQ